MELKNMSYVTKTTLKNQLAELEHMRDNYLTLIQKNPCIPGFEIMRSRTQ